MPPRRAFVDPTRASTGGEAGLRSRFQRDSLLRGVLEENEDMLREIDDLRDKVKVQAHELLSAKKRIHNLEARLSGNEVAKHAMYEKIDDVNAVPVDRAGILRSILKTISAYQFGNCYARILARSQRLVAKPAETPQYLRGECEKEYEVPKEEEATMMRQALRESNRRLDEAYSLLQSYQETPSFSVTEYDELVIACMMEIIGLSKSINVMILEEREFPAERARQLIAAHGGHICDGAEIITPRLPSKP
ncbi:uncharacterized protein Tco025E_05799 [Trypanosoma conorhini]|uniref:Uncharacterized protein n=1 Tax=Trypanosoma conorhini TaxID=83891 RepID=A0A422PA01_9TRYP|nr:uncharacterized protein Tco025E_05799 [Trypanosoma conorhini]RNF14528.1 hypothetical protein Tco025E_05799 [Trypanosoma conorhini]